MGEVNGVNLRFDAKRKLPWGVWIEVRLGTKGRSTWKKIRGAKFYATEAEGQAAYAAACAEIATMRGEIEEDERRYEALKVPPVPLAPKGVVLFERFAQLWLDLHVAQQCEAATYRSYEGLLRTHLLPTMRAWPVTDDVMTPARLANLLGPQLYAKGVKLGNRVSAQRCLSSAFAWGLIFGETRKCLTHNPALGLGRFLRQPTEKRVKRKATPNPMTQQQADALLDWIKTNRREHWEWFLFLIEAGPRVGEVSALKWPSIDLERGKAHIVEAYSASQRWMERKRGDEDGLGEKDTKTHREDQYIDLSTSLVEALQALQIAQRKEAFRCGRKPPRHVFVTSRGTPRRPDGIVRRAFRDACTALKLVGQTRQPFTTHCLRDTFATLKILQGKHPGWVALMLGHETEQTTRERYYKWIRMVEENPLSARR